MRPENQEEEEIKTVLKKAFPATDTELQRDLWPEMLRRLEKPGLVVPWYDWALAAAIVAISFMVPKFLWVLAYYI